MEAAAVHVLPAQIRARRFERECERLRPLGEAYVMRRFGGSLNRADAEDAVSDVVIRLHRRMTEGRLPDNLRATFFTSVRNAAIDQLRSRSSKPTVALEAAADAPTSRAIPAEAAEDRDDAVRLQEALGRMRGNYREAIVLRFGLGLTVPEISRHLKISLPAAKKLVLRATRQIRQRLESIEGAEFCPEMRKLAEQSLFEKEASGLANEIESEVLRAHFAHCGSCRSFLATLHDRLHDIGSTALLGLTADHAAGGGIVDRVAALADTAGDMAQTGADKLRHLAYKGSGALSSGEGAAGGALVGAGQKIAAVCTAGAAATATCVATGIVGPGISAPLGHNQRDQDSRPAKVKVLQSPAPSAPSTPQPLIATPDSPPSSEQSKAAAKAASIEHKAKAKSDSTPDASTAEAQAQQTETGGEFGFEGAPAPAPAPRSTAAPSTSTSTSTSAPVTSPTPAPSSSEGSSSGGGSTTSGGGGGETFGFGG